MRPKEVIGHRPGEPLDLPSQVRFSSGGGTASAQQPEGGGEKPPEQHNPAGTRPANITVNPGVRNVERVEK